MRFSMTLAQAGFPSDGNVVAQVEAFAASARANSAELLAFPEDLMCPRHMSALELRKLAEPLDGPFVQQIASIAIRYNLWIVGTMFEENPNGAPFNTAFVLDNAGILRGTYRKCHLYDAHGVFESHRTSAGASFMRPISSPFGKIALGICYDLRFPELARRAATEGAELLLFPACWYDGPQKPEHWETLLKARAIENELFVAGICHAGDAYVERSLVANPLGCIITPQVAGEALVLAQIDTAQIETVRDAMPVLDHRRDRLYSQ